MQRRMRRGLRAMLVAIALVAVVPEAAAAAPAPVPCNAIGGGKHDCTWYRAGDGRTSGAIVVRAGRVVGYLHRGTNWIMCQQRGATVRNPEGDLNHWYAWTLSDAGPQGNQWGWASAVDAQGGEDFGPFRGVPDCRGAHGSAPSVPGVWGTTPPGAPQPPQPPPPPPPPSPPPPPPAPSVNASWAAMYQHAFGFVGSGDARLLAPTAGTNSDDGLVVVRFFIPSRIAAGGLLRGDARRFDSNPAASSRAVLAWDTETGRLSFQVNHSTTLRGNRDAALPIRRLTRTAVWAARDVRRSDNRVWVAARPGRVDARISVVNSLTNQWPLGAWSVDNDFTVFRGASGGYSLQINGNGYPAVEAHYYPHYGTGAPAVIAQRRVQPYYSGKLPDPGGGAAALDRLSWSDCTQRAARNLFCDSGRGPWGASRPQFLLDWNTRW